MNNCISTNQAIKYEFETRFLVDDLRENWAQDIPVMAKLSSQRLRADIEVNQVDEAITLLGEMRDDFEHPLNQSANISDFDLEESPEEWTKFQSLIDEIILNLAN
jgi:2,4-dienoyl-CoA reductase-like NADH-dependent reductase (Old Yellow Enzyme family)